jgi:hypothetical protein
LSSGEAVPSPGIPRNKVEHGSLDSGGVFDGFKVDALNAEGCVLYIDFLELDRKEDQKVEKPPGCG